MLTPPGHDWRVLLIGGSTGTGKTLIAPLLAHHFHASCSQVDDFRLVMQRTTGPTQHPDLHFFVNTEGVWGRSPEELCERLIKVGDIVSHALEIVVANHVNTNAPLVLEGDGINPTLAARRNFAGLEVKPGDVRSVFLYEPDEEAILANMLARGRGFHENTTEEQRTQARMSRLYGEWIQSEAERLGLPVVEVQPWETLFERVLAKLSNLAQVPK